ncbi:hypothetical protein MMA231_04132 (plasmid) [Asticcacaulis sp. MM231]|jgi:hypothetical protein
MAPIPPRSRKTGNLAPQLVVFCKFLVLYMSFRTCETVKVRKPLVVCETNPNPYNFGQAPECAFR